MNERRAEQDFIKAMILFLCRVVLSEIRAEAVMSREKTMSSLIYRGSRAEGRTIGYRRFWCAACARIVHLATVEQAACAAGQPVEAILRRVERRELHSVSQQNGAVLICLNSLL